MCSSIRRDAELLTLLPAPQTYPVPHIVSMQSHTRSMERLARNRFPGIVPSFGDVQTSCLTSIICPCPCSTHVRTNDSGMTPLLRKPGDRRIIPRVSSELNIPPLPIAGSIGQGYRRLIFWVPKPAASLSSYQPGRFRPLLPQRTTPGPSPSQPPSCWPCFAAVGWPRRRKRTWLRRDP